MACIFCGSEENLTREHVFPGFLGGNGRMLSFGDKVISPSDCLQFAPEPS